MNASSQPIGLTSFLDRCAGTHLYLIKRGRLCKRYPRTSETYGKLNPGAGDESLDLRNEILEKCQDEIEYPLSYIVLGKKRQPYFLTMAREYHHSIRHGTESGAFLARIVHNDCIK